MAFKSYLKHIPIIWLPQDSKELDAEKKSTHKPVFENKSINDFPITRVEDMPLWRQSEIRKKRFRRRQQRFNEHRKQVRFSKGPGWHGTTDDIFGQRTLPHLVRTNSAHCPCESDFDARTRSFLPKVHSRKSSNSSFLAEILTASALKPIAHRQDLKMTEVECKVSVPAKCEIPAQGLYGKHPQLPSICVASNGVKDTKEDQQL